MADRDVPLELLTYAQSLWGLGRDELVVERLGVLCVGLAEEVYRLDTELRALADRLVADDRYAVAEYDPSNLAGRRNHEHGNPGSDGGVQGPAGAATIADHHARV
jgi:hypothetical protein